MKKVFIRFIIFTLFFCHNYGSAQNKNEREFRILKSQFSVVALSTIENKVIAAKRLKFYKEIDSLKISFKAKFKKDRLWYGIGFNEDGTLETIEILIKSADIPNDTFHKIEEYLNINFSKYRIKKLKQQYPSNNHSMDDTFKNAFQNLILPSNTYEIVLIGKKEQGYSDYEIQFDAEGNFKKIRTSLAPNYDHILY